MMASQNTVTKKSTVKERKKHKRINQDLEQFGRSVRIRERRQKVLNENKWIPISSDIPSAPSPACTIFNISPQLINAVINNTTPTPPSGSCSAPSSRVVASTPIQRREYLPSFPWADSNEVCQIMLSKERLPEYQHDPELLRRHPTLQPKERTELLDYLNVICEEQKFKRETFYLAVDYFDRYLSCTTDVCKKDVRLIGITALLIASKVEETRSLKISVASVYNKDPSSEEKITNQELITLKVLKFGLTPVTLSSWVTIFLQSLSSDCEEEKKDYFMMPKYSQHAFIQIIRLLDLCILDEGSLRFPYSMLAAAAMCYTSSQDVALSISGYQWSEIAACVDWMEAFVLVLKSDGPVALKSFDRISASESHNIQTHTTNAELLEKVHMEIESRSLVEISMPGFEIVQFHPQASIAFDSSQYIDIPNNPIICDVMMSSYAMS